MRRPDPLPGQEPCAVLGVPGWFWLALDVGRRIDEGRVGYSDVDADAWGLATTTWAVYHQALEARRWADEQRRKAAR